MTRIAGGGMPDCHCGGSGWFTWRPKNVARTRTEFMWAACADCNDNGEKPDKPELCEGCGEVAGGPFCLCCTQALAEMAGNDSLGG